MSVSWMQSASKKKKKRQFGEDEKKRRFSIYFSCGSHCRHFAIAAPVVSKSAVLSPAKV
jgi:hypothetical protein